MNINKLSLRLKNRLKQPLPGKEAQSIMGIQSKKLYDFPNKEENALPAAVLILLHKSNGEICFTLTERTETVEHHKGQISLPGGVQESNEMLVETALRETEEEIDVHANTIEIIGELSKFFVIVTGFIVHPFIGFLDSSLKFKPAPHEVASVFSVPINDLINDKNMKKETRIIREYNVDVPYFHLNDHKVWGATAMILSEFKTVLKDVMVTDNNQPYVG